MQLLGWSLPSCLPLWLKSSEAEMHVWACWCSIEVLWTGLCRCSIPIKEPKMLQPLLAPVLPPLTWLKMG